jgi:hypothetical protein
MCSITITLGRFRVEKQGMAAGLDCQRDLQFQLASNRDSSASPISTVAMKLEVINCSY